MCKKIFYISTMLILCLICSFAVSAANEALPFDSGIDALKAQFEKGTGPEIEDYSIDYRFYSPVGENDDTKYPLVIWLHGVSDGEYEGKQL